ncbi:MAG: hypothetical protein IPL35_08035 [Sphingobacteriales bacterium]|nr:hypothetical protein [Sphingobacteriales bacterium]
MDFLLILFFFPLLLAITFIVQRVFYANQPCEGYLLPAMFVKLLGSLAFAAVYMFYYKDGDTFGYYREGEIIYNLFLESPLKGLRIWWLGSGMELDTAYYTQQMAFYGEDSFFHVVRLSSFFGLFCWNNFWVITLLFGFLSFWGLWAWFRVLEAMYPDLRAVFFVIMFMIPSVVFWSGGILKDPITITATGWAVWGFYHFFIVQKNRLLALVLMLGAMFFILEIKFYILAGLIPAFLVWMWGNAVRKLLRDKYVFRIVATAVVVGLPFCIYFLSDVIYSYTEQLTLLFVRKAMGFQGWHSAISGATTSGYTLGKVEFTVAGVFSKVPVSIWTSLFRPYFTEVHTAIVLAAAVESTLTLLLTAWVLLKVGILRTFKIIFTHADISAFIIFTLIFAFITGFTSFNFGALVRYKIPQMPFYYSALAIILYVYRSEKKTVSN